MNNPAMPMYGNKNLHSSRWVSSPGFTLPSSAKQEVCNPPAKPDSLKIVIGLVLAALSYTAGVIIIFFRKVNIHSFSCLTIL